MLCIKGLEALSFEFVLSLFRAWRKNEGVGASWPISCIPITKKKKKKKNSVTDVDDGVRDVYV